jgi:hypothetical protein
VTIIRRSAHYRLSLAGGGTDLGEGEGLCVTLSLPWKCHVARVVSYGKRPGGSWVADNTLDMPEWVSLMPVEDHPVLQYLPDIHPHEHFIVTHELPTRVGLGSSAALALAACGNVDKALDVDRIATGAGWQDVRAIACGKNAMVAIDHNGHHQFLYPVSQDDVHIWCHALVFFSTGGAHTEPRNSPNLDKVTRALALAEARKLRDDPTLETLAWCMNAQWERKMATAPAETVQAIDALRRTEGFMAAKSTGSRGAGFGVVLTMDRNGARDMLVERGARVWMP